MFFTNTGRVYVERVYEIDEAARSAQGRSIKNLLDMQAEERIAAILRLERKVSEDGKDITFAEDSGNVVFATKDGTVKKTALNDFVNYRKAGIIAINLEEGNSLVNAVLTTGEQDVIIVTHNGMSIRFSEDQMRTQGRNTIGVRGIKLREGDCVVAMTGIDDDSTILTVTETGYGRKSMADDYRLQTRGGQGVTNYNVAKYGDVCTVLNVTNDDDIIMIASNGIIIRIAVSEISTFSRPAKGVRVMRVAEGEKILSIVATEHSDEAEKGEITEADGAAEGTEAEEPSADSEE
jgi:DNA gyrase subunit A